MKKFAYSGLIGLLFCVSAAFGQQKDNISSEETITYINGKLKGIAQLENARGLLVVEFFKNGVKNRVDKVSFGALNPESVEYMADEKAIVIKCVDKNCIQRRIDIPKTAGQFSRISFAGDFDATTQKGLVKAFEHLIMLFHDNKYKNNTPFE